MTDLGPENFKPIFSRGPQQTTQAMALGGPSTEGQAGAKVCPFAKVQGKLPGLSSAFALRATADKSFGRNALPR